MLIKASVQIGKSRADGLLQEGEKPEGYGNQDESADHAGKEQQSSGEDVSKAGGPGGLIDQG